MNHLEENQEILHTHTLSNGLRIIAATTTSRVVCAGIAVDAGTRDETPGESGMAHLVEHMLFKGTTHRRACHILCRMESVGGELNAYTDKEETVVYSTCLSPHLGRAIELLADVTFHSTCPGHELHKEVDVIADEIESYNDSPAELIFDDFDSQLFLRHPLGRNILGDRERLEQYHPEEVLAFIHRHYRPDRAVLFVRGGVDFRQVVRLAERHLGTLTPPTHAYDSLRTPPPPYVPDLRTIHRDTHQAHVLLGSRAYQAGHPRRMALYLLNNLLGGPGMNSRLNIALRERRGLVYTVESNLTAFTDAGTYSVYFGCDADDVEQCLHLVRRELRRLCEHRLTPTQLAAAQRQLIGQLGVAADHNENQALGMGKAYLHYHHCETLASLSRLISSLTPDQLLEVANEVFADSRLSTLIYL